MGRYYPDYFLKEKSILTRNIDSVEECSKCKLKFLCGGGCANGAIDENGNVMHPNCAETQNQIFVELPRLYKEVKKKNGK